MEKGARSFKTAWFAKAAAKAGIDDDELCDALREAMLGQTDDLGGGVFKKRLNRNRHRSIILAKGGRYWVYQYVFAKSKRANIAADELEDLRVLAKTYAVLGDAALARLIAEKDFTEICHAER